MSEGVETGSATKDLEHYKHKLALELEGARDRHARSLEGFRSGMADASFNMKETIGHGRAALRGAFILNAGGAVTMVGLLLTGLQRSNAKDLAPELISFLAAFSLGALLPTIAALVIYLGQYRYTLALQDGFRRGTGYATEAARHWWRYVAVACVGVSIVCFLFAVIGALWAVGNY
jgi:hypothetical protein